MLLPGPEAQQLAIYIGWLMHQTAGGIIAGGLFVLPGVVSIMALSVLYATFGHIGMVVAWFFGLKAAVLAVVLQAVVRVGKRALKNRIMQGLAAAAFVAIFFLGVPFPLIVLVAGPAFAPSLPAVVTLLARVLRPRSACSAKSCRRTPSLLSPNHSKSA